MAVSKTSVIVALTALALLGGATIAGGIALERRLSSLYDVDVEAETQKVLLVGTYKEVDGYKPKLEVGLIPADGRPVYKTLDPSMMDYNTSGQVSEESCWINLSSWFKESIGDVRIDEWCSDGGRISFQQSVGGITSAIKTLDYGGGSYFVDVPDGEGRELTVLFDTVILQITEVDVS